MEMFKDSDFAIFQIDGLKPRMAAIRAEIQPSFQAIMDTVKPMVEAATGHVAYVHIAQHRMRTKYAPDITWSAISLNKRGYKNEPHFQLGILDEYVFMYLSVIDHPAGYAEMADAMLADLAELRRLGDDFVFSKDHMAAGYESIQSESLSAAIERLKNVKAGELMIGRVISRESPIWKANPLAYIQETFTILMPLYLTDLAKHGALN
jgi:uncharacterized protein YktB (UPF0637 family)